MMWPFTFIAKRSYRRHVDAAFAILIARNTYEALPLCERAKVEEKVAGILSLTTIPYATHQTNSNWVNKSAYHAAALYRLGIEPSTPAVAWTNVLRIRWIRNPAFITLNFQEFSEATDEAMKHLAMEGGRNRFFTSNWQKAPCKSQGTIPMIQCRSSLMRYSIWGWPAPNKTIKADKFKRRTAPLKFVGW